MTNEDKFESFWASSRNSAVSSMRSPLLAQETPAGLQRNAHTQLLARPASRQTLLGLVHFAIQDRFSVAMMSSQSLMKFDSGSRGPLSRSSRRRAVAR